ncbi:MAG: VWA domain-containing protein [Phycisphaeraceae bacterium]|nr:VWA domain-containing protein [Phycisphaeraceae bacterium]
MTLLWPVYLLLLLPLGVMMWYWPQPTAVLRVLRGLTLLLIVLALTGLMVKLPSRAGTIIVVADRSASMPGNHAASEKELIELISKARVSEDRVGVVTFGEHVRIEHSPQTVPFTDFTQDVGVNGSRLSEAVERALSLIEPGTPGRVVVLSDGRWTGTDPVSVGALAATRGIPIDFREMGRTSASDTAITRLDAPVSLAPREAFMVTAWVRSPVSQEIVYELRRGDQSISQGKRHVDAGISRLIFRDIAEQPGTLQYSLNVTGQTDDPVPENNTARLLVGVEGPRPMLCISDSADAGYASLLRAGGLNITIRKPAEMRWDLADLSNFTGVIVENIPAGKLGSDGLKTLAAWVSDAGGGLLMTGGRQSFGPGGYFKSALDPILPVSMELRREHRKHSLAIVVALDRSGSMAVPVGGGRTKMDLADLGTAQVIDMLSPMDQFGCIAVDSAPHTIVELSTMDNKEAARSRVLSIDSQGGGIFVYEALAAAAKMISASEPQTRHIILFADAADAEEPGQYRDLIDACRKAGITISVIGLGTEKDSDAELLKDVARRGEGRIFFTNDPEELPRLFAQDTFVVARSTFVDEVTGVSTTGVLSSLTGKTFTDPPPVGGYNLCYLRDGAQLAVVTQDEYKAPVVAAWQAGIGRATCLTLEVNGEFTGPVRSWKELGDFLTSLARWTGGAQGNLPEHMLLTQDVEGGICRLELHLDPQRKTDPISSLPVVTTLRGHPGSKPATERVMMRWTSADSLTAQIPLYGDETVLSTVNVEGAGLVSMAPVCLPYSPEYRPTDNRRGLVTLRSLARSTGGQEIINVADVWRDLPRQPRLIFLTPWLAIAAVICLLLEVLERRTGVLSSVQWGRLRGMRLRLDRAEKSPRDSSSTGSRESTTSTGVPRMPTAAESPASEASSIREDAPQADLSDVLQDARRRAQGRIKR